MITGSVVVEVLAFFTQCLESFNGFAGAECDFDELIGFKVFESCAGESSAFSGIYKLRFGDEPRAVFVENYETFGDCGC